MKFCSQCGAANEDTSFSCYACGAMLEEEQTNTRRSRGLNIPKPVLAIGGILLAVALVVGIVIWAVSGGKGGVDNALGQTMKEFGGDKEKPTQFAQFFDVAGNRLEEGEYTMYASFSGGPLDLQLHTDYSRSARMLRGEIGLSGYNLEYSVKKDIFQIRFPGEYEVYGFNVKDINKITEKFNEMLSMPFVGQLLPVRLPTDLKLDFFKESDLKLEGLLAGIAGKEYEAFREGLTIEEWNDETITRAGQAEVCSVYKISWQSEDLNNLLGALGSGGLLPNVGGLVNSLLPEMDPYLFCYVNSEGYLVGVRFTTAGSKCFFLLNGRENLWDEFSLTAETMTGEIKVYEGAMDRSGASFELYLKSDSGEKLISVSYNDDSGDFSLATAAAGTIVTGRVTCQVGEASMRLNWNTPETGAQELAWTVTRLQKQPEQLGEKYSDLMSMAWKVIENMINDLLTN